MWFRSFLAVWSLAFLALFGWLASHTSSQPIILGRYSAGYFILIAGIGALAAAGLAAQSGVFYLRLHSIRREIVLTVSSILISLLMVELAIRLFDPLGVSYFAEATKYEVDKISDPVRVYKHAPGLRKTYQGVSVSTNELGLRDRALEKKDHDELRILLLGDSVTFGWGVPMEATFGRRLETLLSAGIQRRVRTVNSGVGGYNTVQEHAFLKTHVDVIQPDVVLLLYVRNDIESNDPPFDPRSQRSLQGKTPPETIVIMLQRSWLYRLGLFVFRYSRSSGGAAFDKNARGVKESLAALSGIGTFCRERGIPFITFFYRSKSESTAPPALLSEIGAIGTQHGFPVVDIASWWGDVNMRSVTNSVVDVHPNERGHEILAIGMADFLMTYGVAGKPAAAIR
jgi:hypothetical protein